MKTLLVLFVCCASVGVLQAQSAFEDARMLADNRWAVPAGGGSQKLSINVTAQNYKQVLPLLFRYLNDAQRQQIQQTSDAGEQLDLCKQFYQSNAYLTVAGSVQDSPLAGASVQSSAAALAQTVGGLNVTTVADGLARFLVTRMKQELSVMFFDQFNTTLQQQPDLKALFPHTVTILLTAQSEIYFYQRYLPALREAFSQDLANLIPQVNQWIQSPPSDPKSVLKDIKKDPKVYSILRLAMQAVTELHQGEHPGDILHTLSQLPYLDTVDQQASPMLRTADLLSQSLRNTSGSERYWITGTDFRRFEDIGFTKLFFGLLHQHSLSEPIVYTSGKKLDDILSEAAPQFDKLEKLRQYILSLRTSFDDVHKNLETIRQPDGTASLNNYFSLAQNLINTCDKLFLIKPLADVTTAARQPQGWYTQLKAYTQHVADLYADVSTKAYQSAVWEMAAIANLALGAEKAKPLTDGLVKYGTFIASVASAKSSEEVQEAIEAIALPPGSALIKRMSPFNISVNSYLGLYAGNEYLEHNNVDLGKTGWGTTYGLTAPVGIAVSTNMTHKGKTLGSLSAFVSLIDVGAIASFRVKDDATEQLPEIKLQNIFAPGLYAVYGIGKTPLSIGYGWQKGPQLRQVNVPDPNNPGTFTNTLLNGYRWSFFLAVDIPLANLYTRTR